LKETVNLSEYLLGGLLASEGAARLSKTDQTILKLFLYMRAIEALFFTVLRRIEKNIEYFRLNK